MIYMKNQNGLNVAGFSVVTGAAARQYSTVQSWPDYLEHDPSKECVQVQYAKMTLDAQCLVSAWAEVSVEHLALVGFRSGSATVSTAGLIPHGLRNWMWKSVNCYRSIAAAVVGSALVPFPEVEWNFPLGLPMNPGQLTLGVCLMGGGAAFLDAGYIMAEFHYKWVKISQSDLQSFLGWENQGE